MFLVFLTPILSDTINVVLLFVSGMMKQKQQVTIDSRQCRDLPLKLGSVDQPHQQHMGS